MANRSNPNWTNPERSAPGPSTNSFEETASALKLAPEEYVNSPALKEWARRNKDQKYVPTDLLEAWGFIVENS